MSKPVGWGSEAWIQEVSKSVEQRLWGSEARTQLVSEVEVHPLSKGKQSQVWLEPEDLPALILLVEIK